MLPYIRRKFIRSCHLETIPNQGQTPRLVENGLQMVNVCSCSRYGTQDTAAGASLRHDPCFELLAAPPLAFSERALELLLGQVSHLLAAHPARRCCAAQRRFPSQNTTWKRRSMLAEAASTISRPAGSRLVTRPWRNCTFVPLSVCGIERHSIW